MKKEIFTSQSGQATTELVFMLLGFAMLMTGLICTMSLEIFNTDVLLDAKYKTERATGYENSQVSGGAGKELRGWEYKNDIPFTLNDTPIYQPEKVLPDAYNHLGDSSKSKSDDYFYEYLPLQNFPSGAFKSDYNGRYQRSVVAANLITRDGDPDRETSTFSALLNSFYSQIASLLGVKIDLDSLRRNPSNRVYLPVNGEL